MKIRAVIFDMDGTINTSRAYYDFFRREYEKYLAEHLGVSLREARLRLAKAKRRLGSLTRSLESLGVNRREFYRAMASRLKVELLVNRDQRLSEVVKELRSMGLKVAIVTNSGRPLVLKVLEAKGFIEEDFDLVQTSFEASLKPSLEPFLQASRRLGIKPQEAIYVGDRVKVELMSAKKAGMNTVKVGQQGDKSRWVDWTVRTIYELPELLRRGRLGL